MRTWQAMAYKHQWSIRSFVWLELVRLSFAGLRAPEPQLLMPPEGVPSKNLFQVIDTSGVGAVG